MNKTVNHCYNCPFYHATYDDYSTHEQPTCTCGLAEFLKYEEYFIDDDENSVLEPPEWCPIAKEGTVSLKFKRLSMSNVLEISKYTNQIEQLDYELDNIDDMESEEYKSKYNSMMKLCEKLEELRNEE